jgi:hypothetical protein
MEPGADSDLLESCGYTRDANVYPEIFHHLIPPSLLFAQGMCEE